MTKRAFAEVSGHHDEQQRLKRKEEWHAIYVANGMEPDQTNVEKNGCMAFLNEGDTETHAELDSAGKISEASVIESSSSQKYSSSDSVLNNEKDILADGLLENLDYAVEESNIHDESENHNDLKNTSLLLQNISRKRRKDDMLDFTEYGSCKKACRDPDSMIELAGGILEMQNNINGHHDEQQRLKRKEEGHAIYVANGIEPDQTNVEKNGCMAFLNEGEIETHAELDSAGNISEASDSVLNNEDDFLADSSKSSSEQSLVFSATDPYLVTNEDCQRSNLSQYDDSSSETTDAATMNNHLSTYILLAEKDGLLENLDNAVEESYIHEEFENHNDLKNTSLKPQNISRKRRKDNMLDFTEYGSSKKACLDPSLGDNLVGASANGMQNNIDGEKASPSYMNEGSLIKDNAAEKDMVFRTSNCLSCSAEVDGQHKIDSMPLLTECGGDENSEKAFQKTRNSTVPEKMNCTMHEDNLSQRSFSPAISIEINQKVLYANFKGELSLPPSPITGVIDCFVSNPNRESNHLHSFNEEETTFSFQIPNKSFAKEIPKNKIGFIMQGALGIHEDRVTQQKEIMASSFSSTLEEDPLSKEEKNEVRDIGSMPPEKSLSCGRSEKKLLVLDLNGLLCDIVNDYYSSYPVEKKVGGKPFFKRPFCDDFLKFCFDHFYIGIWSSRRKYNVDSAVDYLMGEFKDKLLFCWDQSKCTYTGAKTIENHRKPLVLKELKKLWNKEESDLPWEKGDFSPSNTLLIDDSPYKALCNPPHTAIFPHPYQYADERDNSLGPGGDIRVYLESLLISDDVQRYVEEHPFGQPAITNSDQHWYFYCKIIKSNSTHLS